jgi:hypothetical protein
MIHGPSPEHPSVCFSRGCLLDPFPHLLFPSCLPEGQPKTTRGYLNASANGPAAIHTRPSAAHARSDRLPDRTCGGHREGDREAADSEPDADDDAVPLDRGTIQKQRSAPPAVHSRPTGPEGGGEAWGRAPAWWIDVHACCGRPSDNGVFFNPDRPTPGWRSLWSHNR